MTGRATKPELSERDKLVLSFVAECGIATAAQLERLAFPVAQGSSVSAARRARRCLARLVANGQLTRLDRRIGGVRAGSSGFIYQLTTRGRRSLGLSGRGRTWEPGGRFIDHALAAGQLHVGLVEAQRRGSIDRLVVVHEPATLRRFSASGGMQRLCPDLLVEVTTPDGWELRWFVEIDRGTEHLPTVLRKCRLYEQYWRSGQENRHHEIFPRVLWSVPDDRRARRIAGAIGTARNLSGDLFRIATADDSVGTVIKSSDNQEGGHP